MVDAQIEGSLRFIDQLKASRYTLKCYQELADLSWYASSIHWLLSERRNHIGVSVLICAFES